MIRHEPRDVIRPRYVIVGLLVALVTGVDRGLSIPWLDVSWRVNWVLLMVDIAFWTMVGFAVDDVAPKFKHHLATTGHG